MSESLELLSALRSARTGELVDLSHPLRRTTSHYPTHVGFELELSRRHGYRTREDGSSSASCTFRMGSHTGTHMDALGHVSIGGRLFDGSDARDACTTEGLLTGSIDKQPPVIAAGVMLDIASLHGSPVLDGDYTITASDLAAAAARQGTEISTGSVVLVRTGWDTYWETDGYIATATPGPDMEAAQWLADNGARIVGSDTAVFEKGPVQDAAPVHTELLIHRRIPIIENLRLSELGSRNLNSFLFIAAPLPLQGGTASPIRPLAIG